MSYLNEIKQNLELLQERKGSIAVPILALDALLKEHRASMPAQLKHYLSQRSYDKALAWVSAALTEQKASGPAFTPPPGGCLGS